MSIPPATKQESTESSVIMNNSIVVVVPSRTAAGELVIDQRSRTEEGRSFFWQVRDEAFLQLDPATRWPAGGGSGSWGKLEDYLDRASTPVCGKVPGKDGAVVECAGIRTAIDAFVEEPGLLGEESGPHAVASPSTWTVYLHEHARGLPGTVDEARAVAGVRRELRQYLNDHVAKAEQGRFARRGSMTRHALLRLASLGAVWAKAGATYRADPVLQRVVQQLDRLLPTVPNLKVD